MPTYRHSLRINAVGQISLLIIVIKMTDNSTQSSAWLLPLEVIELLLFDVHPKVLVSFALTCKELLDYILKNESDSVLINMWGNAYIKYINTETRYSKAQVNLNLVLNIVIITRKYFNIKIFTVRITKITQFLISEPKIIFVAREKSCPDCSKHEI